MAMEPSVSVLSLPSSLCGEMNIFDIFVLLSFVVIVVAVVVVAVICEFTQITASIDHHEYIL